MKDFCQIPIQTIRLIPDLIRDKNLAESIARTRSKPSHIVGDFHHICRKRFQCAVRKHELILRGQCVKFIRSRRKSASRKLGYRIGNFDVKAARCIESGADAYIPKPFETQYIKAVIKQLIDKQQKLHKYYNSSASSFDYMDGKLISKENRNFIQSTISIIEQNIGNADFTPEKLADSLCISLRSLYRKFKELGLPSPKDFIKKQRIEYAAKLLVNTKLSIQEIMYNAGFSTRSHFYKEFSNYYNTSPKEYREQQKNLITNS